MKRVSVLQVMNGEECRFYKHKPHTLYCMYFIGDRKIKNQKNYCHKYCSCKERQDVLDGKVRF